MTREEYLERCRSLAEPVRERAPTCEKLRRVPDESMKELLELGLLRALQPRRFGGFELDVWTLYEGAMEIAASCASTGWVLGVLGVHQWQLALFAESAQREVWDADPAAQISSSYAPTGKVESVAGGYRLTGRWSFSSGCDHCAWVFLGGMAPTDGPVLDMRTFLLPRSDYEIFDNWHVAGLCGTGSKDIVVDGAFVPEARTHRFLDGFLLRSPGHALNDGPLYRHSFGTVFSSALAAPALGAARGALELFAAQARARQSALDKSKVADDAFTQARLGDAAAEVDAARECLERDWRELAAAARAGVEPTRAARVRTRADATRATSRALRAVDLLFEASGGRAIFLDNPIQRVFRDLHAMRAHAFNNPDKAARQVGRFALAPDAPPSEPGDLLI